MFFLNIKICYRCFFPYFKSLVNLQVRKLILNKLPYFLHFLLYCRMPYPHVFITSVFLLHAPVLQTPWTSSKQFEDEHQTRVAVQEGRKKSNKSISVGRGSWYKKKEVGNEEWVEEEEEVEVISALSKHPVQWLLFQMVGRPVSKHLTFV